MQQGGKKNAACNIQKCWELLAQPRPQGAFPWLWEKRPGDEVVVGQQCCARLHAA